MEHRGMKYTVVQTANPTGWKWTVSIDGKRTKNGSSFRRIMAVHAAEKFIESYMKNEARKPAEDKSGRTAETGHRFDSQLQERER